MKNTVAILICLLFVSTSFAQKNPTEYLSRIPSLPENPCSIKNSEVKQYLARLEKLDDELLKDIESRKKLVESNNQISEKEAKQNIANQYGLSNSDIQKLSDENLSEEEKMAIVNKAMQNKHNISLDEAKSVSEMSEEGKQAWAEAYAAEQLADAEGNKDAIDKKNKKDKKKYDLAKEQETITQRMMTAGKKFDKKMSELEKQDKIALKELEDAVKPLCKNVEIGKGSNDEGAIGNIRAYQKKYCEKMTTSYFEILEEKFVLLKTLLPDIKRLEEINYQLNQQTLGTSKKLSSSGLAEVESIRSYITELKTAFKYRIVVCPAVVWE